MTAKKPTASTKAKKKTAAKSAKTAVKKAARTKQAATTKKAASTKKAAAKKVSKKAPAVKKKTATKKVAAKKAATRKAAEATPPPAAEAPVEEAPKKAPAKKAAKKATKAKEEGSGKGKRLTKKELKSKELDRKVEESGVLDDKQTDVNDRIRLLIRRAKEQGFLTYKDINDQLPESVDSTTEIENVITILENLDIDIIDAKDVEGYKQRLEETVEEEVRNAQSDILDDPVRMYLKQMGQVPLLTREEEVEISKRIEAAETEAMDMLFSIAFTKDFQRELAQKLIDRDERFDRVVLDKKIESREQFFKLLPKLIEQIDANEKKLDEAWATAEAETDEAVEAKARARYSKYEAELRPIFRKFCFKLKVFEEYLETLEPMIREIQNLVESLKLAERAVTRRGRTVDVEKVNRRLEEIRKQLRVEPEAFLGILQDVRKAHASRPTGPRPKWSRPICVSSSRLPRNTPTAASPSSTSSRRATWA
jgi:RNA polymerase primary sigma factor